MSVGAYALFAYGLTALISLLVTGIIVLISKLTGKAGDTAAEQDK